MLQGDTRVAGRHASDLKALTEWVISLCIVAACSGVAVLLRNRLEPSTFAMLFLLGVVFVSMRYRRSAAIVNALLSVSAFYYFCVPVHDSFVVEDSNYILTLVAM